ASQSRRSRGAAAQSRASGSASTESMRAASATLLAIGPMCATVPVGDGGQNGTRPWVGLIPNTPVNALGMRIEPPPSVPSARAPMPEATAAAAPPDDPPGVFAGFQGLRVIPVSGLSVTPFQPNSGVAVLPRSTAPASRNRATAGASSFHGPFGSTVFEPRSVGQPRARITSFTETGTPSSGPSGSPLRERALRVDEAERVQHRVQALDALERRARRLDRRERAVAVALGELGGGEVAGIAHLLAGAAMPAWMSSRLRPRVSMPRASSAAADAARNSAIASADPAMPVNAPSTPRPLAAMPPSLLAPATTPLPVPRTCTG